MLVGQTCVLGRSPAELTEVRDCHARASRNRFIHSRVRLSDSHAGLWHVGCITRGGGKDVRTRTPALERSYSKYRPGVVIEAAGPKSTSSAISVSRSEG